jgi:hypothetical protein
MFAHAQAGLGFSYAASDITKVLVDKSRRLKACLKPRDRRPCPACCLRSTSPCWIDSQVVAAAEQDFPKGRSETYGCWAHRMDWE